MTAFANEGECDIDIAMRLIISAGSRSEQLVELFAPLRRLQRLPQIHSDGGVIFECGDQCRCLLILATDLHLVEHVIHGLVLRNCLDFWTPLGN